MVAAATTRMAHDTSEDWQRALFEASLDGVAILDAAGCCIDVNPALCEMLGARREALVGARFDDFVVGGKRRFATDGDVFAGENWTTPAAVIWSMTVNETPEDAAPMIAETYFERRSVTETVAMSVVVSPESR